MTFRRIATIVALLVTGVLVKLGVFYGLGALGVDTIPSGLLSGAASLAALVGAGLWLDRHWPDFRDQTFDLLPRRAIHFSQFLRGLALGLLMFGAVWSMALLLGGIHLKAKPLGALHWLGVTGVVLLGTVINAAWEEVAFRGWTFAAAAKLLPARHVALLIGTLFGLLHLVNPHPSVAAIVSICFAGWLLGFALIATRSIALPLGLHTGWNLLQSLLTSKLFWEVTRHDTWWRSGGKWGLEASLPGIAVTGLVAAAFAWRAWRLDR